MQTALHAKESEMFFLRELKKRFKNRKLGGPSISFARFPLQVLYFIFSQRSPFLLLLTNRCCILLFFRPHDWIAPVMILTCCPDTMEPNKSLLAWDTERSDILQFGLCEVVYFSRCEYFYVHILCVFSQENWANLNNFRSNYSKRTQSGKLWWQTFKCLCLDFGGH